MRRLITWLVDVYNKRTSPEKRIEVREPESFIVSSTFELQRNSELHGESDSGKEKFIENMVKEKIYDLRHQLINQIYKEGIIKETITNSDTITKVELELKTYKHEAKRKDN